MYGFYDDYLYSTSICHLRKISKYLFFFFFTLTNLIGTFNSKFLYFKLILYY